MLPHHYALLTSLSPRVFVDGLHRDPNVGEKTLQTYSVLSLTIRSAVEILC